MSTLFTQICKANEAVDLRQRQMFTLMVLEDGQSALVGVVDPMTNLAAFVTCHLDHAELSECLQVSEFSFEFNELTMTKLAEDFTSHLQAPASTEAESFGETVGVLNGLGVSPSAIALFFGVSEMSPKTVPPMNPVARLFNLNRFQPTFLNLKTGPNGLDSKTILAALTKAVADLKLPKL